MTRSQIMELLLLELSDGEAHSVEPVINSVLENNGYLFESQVRSALLGLCRMNKVELTDEFKVRIPGEGYSTL
jgi:hypothetical protein